MAKLLNGNPPLCRLPGHPLNKSVFDWLVVLCYVGFSVEHEFIKIKDTGLSNVCKDSGV